jgi:excinuclease ABC subunit C
LYNRTRPCLEYQIGRCPAPCVFEIDRAKYREGVDDVLMFLEGKGEELVTRLESRMWGASDRLEFEVAAHYRNQIGAVNKTLEKQRIALPSLLDQDVYGLYGELGRLEIAALVIRNGRIENVLTQLFDEVGFPEKDLLESFLLQRYSEVIPPPEILVPIETESAEALSELLTERRGTKVTVRVPQRGDGASLLEMARQNAENSFREAVKKTGALEQTLSGLKDKLRLRRVPEKIECYDISNMGGMLIVGSQVSFVRALPNKAGYRQYKVKSTKGQDDFASMYEVLSRRLRRAVAENDLPDLLVIDGGKGQLNAARAAIKDAGIAELDVVSLAKSRVVGVDDQDATRHSPERVFVPNAKDPIILKQDSAELLLLARIRDEAHRFAITFQRKLRMKQRMRSALEDIPGVGAKRKTALLRNLGSLKRVRAASIAELAAVPGMGKAAAARVFAFFHPGDAPKSQPDRAEEPRGAGEAPTPGGSSEDA